MFGKANGKRKSDQNKEIRGSWRIKSNKYDLRGLVYD